MDFRSAFDYLQEIFPQVDNRILKAVAIEHSKDVDAAVEFIFSEVLPSIGEPPYTSCTVRDAHEVAHSSSEGQGGQDVLSDTHVVEVDASLLSEQNSRVGTKAPDDVACVTSTCMVDGSHLSGVGGSEESCSRMTHHEIFEDSNSILCLEPKPVGHEVLDLNSNAIHLNPHILNGMLTDAFLSNFHRENYKQYLLDADPEEASVVEHMVKSSLRPSENGGSVEGATTQEFFGVGLSSKPNPVGHEVPGLNNNAVLLKPHNLNGLLIDTFLSTTVHGENYQQSHLDADFEEACQVEHFVKSCLGSSENGGNAEDATTQEFFGLGSEETTTFVQTSVPDFPPSIVERYPEFLNIGAVELKDIQKYVSKCKGQPSSCSVECTDTVSTSCLGSSENGDNAEDATTQEFLGLGSEETTTFVQTDVPDFPSSIAEKYPELIKSGAVELKDMKISISECKGQPSSCSVECTDTVSAVSTSTCDVSISVPEERMDYTRQRGEVLEDANGAIVEYGEHYRSHLTESSSELLVKETNMVSNDDNNVPMTLATRSGHGVNIDLLEDSVTDARSNKKMLVSSMESLINTMKEVHILEERAKEAKEEASTAGKDILTKVEELKQMLKHAKLASDMHAGEIYGEKAILSTESRELQSRLLSLSDERNKSFSIIKEIRETLDARVAAARQEIAAAEQQKLEKEELARNALKEQELIMDAIAEESRKLQEEAAHNSKLREFLIDSGRVVDTLQGEIAVIFEDVMLLKERVDGSLPLTSSLRLTTCCLASSSSSSSYKSMFLSDKIAQPVELDENSMAVDQTQQQEDILTKSSEDVNASDNCKVSSIDDWELFDRESSLC